MKTEYLVWTGKYRFTIKYTEDEAIKYAKRVNAGEIEKCQVTSGGLIIESEIIWQKSKQIKS